jgi:hypothetical protein
LIQDTLRQVRALEDRETRYRICALLISELRWQGEDGGRALSACLDDLDDASACLACVALGLSRQPAFSEQVWRCYLRLKRRPAELDFIGDLWGLIDLQDRRVASELIEYLKQRRSFYELFGFLSLAGDDQALPLLIASALELGQKQSADPLMAATGIAHRVGKPVLVREVLESSRLDQENIESKTSPEETAADEIGNMILARSMDEVEAYFALFYRGFRQQDATAALKSKRQNKG